MKEREWENDELEELEQEMVIRPVLCRYVVDVKFVSIRSGTWSHPISKFLLCPHTIAPSRSLSSILSYLPRIIEGANCGHDQSVSPEWVFCFATLVDLVSMWFRLGRDLEDDGSLRARLPS
jgi:hypothetical protein